MSNLLGLKGSVATAGGLRRDLLCYYPLQNSLADSTPNSLHLQSANVQFNDYGLCNGNPTLELTQPLANWTVAFRFRFEEEGVVNLEQDCGIKILLSRFAKLICVIGNQQVNYQLTDNSNHIAVVSINNQISSYVNGKTSQLVNSLSIANLTRISLSATNHIQLRDFGFWLRPLSQVEIKAIQSRTYPFEM